MKNTFVQMMMGLAAASILTAGPVVYTQNFETNSVGFSGSGSVQSPGTMPGFGAGHWRNDGTEVTTLSLTGLASHSQIFINFDLAIWDSADISQTCLRSGKQLWRPFCSPDTFQREWNCLLQTMTPNGTQSRDGSTTPVFFFWSSAAGMELLTANRARATSIWSSGMHTIRASKSFPW